jgi:uncharacterized membrane protein
VLTTALNRRAVAGGLLVGVGLGGFFDGIVFHQVLQWHHMLTSEGGHPASTVAGLKSNTLADGLFHLFAWIATVAGWALLWPFRERLTARQLLGLALAGWGAFNLIEGLVDHQLLGLHHVRSGSGHVLYDIGYLALGAMLLATGAALARRPS